MLGRSIQVSLSKPSKAVTDGDDTDFNDKATVIAACVESAIKKTAFAILGYVVLDTVRKVLIIKAQSSA